jgi:hypothetical protein
MWYSWRALMEDSTTNRRKTSLSLTPVASKALARAKFELYSRYDLHASQSEILEALILEHTKDLGRLRKLLEFRREGAA